MMKDSYPVSPLCGYTVIKAIDKDGVVVNMASGRNDIMYGLIEATARLFGGGSTYKAAAMYFEFQNLADPGDTPDYPVYGVDDDVSYYLNLESSLDRDFVRVPLVGSPGVSETASGVWLMSSYAITPAGTTTGFWGKGFATANNSVVIGGALVACPDIDNQSKDIILCRNYPSGTKVPKTVGGQISMAWNVEFSYPGLGS